MQMRAPGLVAVLTAASLAVVACSAAPGDEIPPSRAPTTTTSAPAASASPSQEVRRGIWRVAGEASALATSLAAPWSVLPLPGGGALVSERESGTIRELGAGGTLREVGVVPDVVSGGESGLHGLALLESESVVWLYAYHGASDDNRVVRMPLLGAAGGYTLGAVEVIVEGIPRANTHNGGRIAFGPEGMLYVATGDAQQRDAAQDAAALGGKILRVTPEGAPADGNPFGTAVYSLGHRNVQGLAWTADGALWASEFGQDTWDELNRIEPGANYGWPEVEGVGGDGRFVDPVAVWTTDEASPSGIAAIGETVFVAGLRGERLWAVDTGGGEASIAFSGQGRLRDVVAAPDGSLWVLTNNTDGRGAPRDGDDVLLRLDVAPGP